MGISLTVFDAICMHSQARGNARLALVMLARFVSEEKVRAGQPALAHPSIDTLAELCCCSHRTVEAALAKLSADGEIHRTGRRMFGRYRGTIEYELLPGVSLEELLPL